MRIKLIIVRRGKMDTVLISVIVATVAALGAVGAAIGSFLSAKSTRVVTEAQLVLRFLDDYSEWRMLESLRLLRKWKAENGTEFAEEWRKALEAGSDEALEVDKARRHVAHYFYKALRLYESGYVRLDFLKEVGRVDGINIFYDIVEELEYALNPAYDKSTFEKLNALLGRSGTGKLIRPLPYK
jgi:hypothetical protein